MTRDPTDVAAVQLRIAILTMIRQIQRVEAEQACLRAARAAATNWQVTSELIKLRTVVFRQPLQLYRKGSSVKQRQLNRLISVQRLELGRLNDCP